ncbi:LysR family transcriptional regulator [Chelativorans alearense]|uniref:LysR substrate-binding domain-containing protein n=1 Tax=Chelativorans alearense TaxID=2681495 RepID=UPI0013D8D129|nr:LysR family transcriptional regulator [Chelativorans alearense]
MAIDVLRHLKYVLVTLEHGSMRQAAEVLGVRGTTVSRNITTIEQQFDMQIFERRNNGVRLTEEGQRWLESIRGLYDGLDEILRETARRNRKEGTLRIGLCSPVGLEFLLRLIERFRARHPEIRVAIRDGVSNDQVSAIRRRHIDVAFVCGSCDVRHCCSEEIWEEGLSIMLPAGHRLAKDETLTWEELAGERLLVPMGANGPQLDECFLERVKSDSAAPTIEHCHAGQATVLIKVRLGNGFTVVGESFAREIAINGTIWRSVTGKNSRCPVKAVWLDSNPKRAVLHLISIARNMAEERRAHPATDGREG